MYDDEGHQKRKKCENCTGALMGGMQSEFGLVEKRRLKIQIESSCQIILFTLNLPQI